MYMYKYFYMFVNKKKIVHNQRIYLNLVLELLQLRIPNHLNSEIY